MKFVIFSTMPWDFLWQRPHQIASRLANKGAEVIYFQNPIYLTPSIIVKNFRERNIFLKRKIGKNLHVANLFLLPFLGKLGFISEKFGLVFFRIQLTSAGFKPDVAIFYSSRYVFLLKTLNSARIKIVYDCIDEFSGFSNVSDVSKALEAEKELIAAASFTIATSLALCEKISKINLNCFYVPNAADFTHFNSALNVIEVPLEIRTLKHPVIGFIGALWDWIDVDLICKLAESHPEFSILIVGPVNFGLDKLEAHPNITLLGAKPYKALPQYLSCMDVCLIPFKLNKLTIASNPIKLYEYLAAGKPVVSTPLPEVCRNASDIVYIGESDKDFIRKVEEAVKETEKPKNNEEVWKRINFARNNSWEKRIETIEQLLEHIII